ncbi:glycine zipper 2TM domain-containing protein [Sansalvadorimonas sp. 2012CJ34-2]|uniref:Glycine zipper 2TM domain-containing protein n=1 Tax=Parendozoicomonas callyspongiae TaxID=2942213 RepID=A0ABT0PE16_9GAMM|nr:glycine zipper 2TM domain-containing protein [Sansalvadorimonas sp. 2012CJ34-2]MCL6269600.1 glycine zipper 2TM domain-containing protein [Sansalvadorimonas sp. 2012CJ34-2]
MKFLHIPAFLIMLPVLLLTGGCMSDMTGTNYDRGEARTLQSVQFGEIVDIENVKLEGSKSGVGTVAGAAVGGLAGSKVGHGRGSAVAAIAGAVAGGVLGNAAENKITEGTGLNITVRLDNGNHVSVVQQLEKGNSFRVGDRVRVLTQGRTARVVHSAH